MKKFKCNLCGAEFDDQHECSVRTLKQQNQKMRRALEFYADTKNWAVEIIKDNGNKHRIAHVVTGDSGERARSALEQSQ